MKRAPMNCEGCFHNLGLGVCRKDSAACKYNNYAGYRFKDFVQLSEYITRNHINCFFASLDEDGGVQLEVRE